VWTEEPLDAFDERVLARVEAGLPLVPCPFAALAFELGTAEADIRARLERLQRTGRLHHLGAIALPRGCGWSEASVALRMPREVERAARVALADDAVVDCDERDHGWNVWLTLAAPGRLAALQASAERLARAARADGVAVFPTQRDFSGPDTDLAAFLDDSSLATLDVLDTSLPLVEEPFAVLARAAGLDEWTLFKQTLALSERGVLRFGAVVRDDDAEILTAWAVPPAQLQPAGGLVTGLDGVARCVARRPTTDFPYTLFVTVRRKTLTACQAVADAVRDALAGADGVLMARRRAIKRARLRLRGPMDTSRPRTSEQPA
jgi:DNA-binding Lrp family transcriptional regulator